MKFGYLLIFVAVAGALLSLWRMGCFGPAEKVYPVPPPVEGDAAGATDTAYFPGSRKVMVKSDGSMVDLELPYTRMVKSDAGTIYTVLGTYAGKQVGFELTMPGGRLAQARFASIGGPSDQFLRLLHRLFKIEMEPAARFAAVEMADCLPMGDYVDSVRKSSHGVYAS